MNSYIITFYVNGDKRMKAVSAVSLNEAYSKANSLICFGYSTILDTVHQI